MLEPGGVELVLHRRCDLGRQVDPEDFSADVLAEWNDLDHICAPIRRSESISEDVAIAALFDMAAEAVFQLRPVEGRLLQLLLGVRERLDLEHDKSVSADVALH